MPKVDPAARRRAPAGAPSVWGGVLVGGRSRRMGRPKQDLHHQGRSFLEIALAAVEHLEGPVLVGGPARDGYEVVEDAPDVPGPLAGVLGALRSRPGVGWVLLACDLPLVDRRAVDWLLSRRAPDRPVVLPRVAGRVQPLLALYEPNARSMLEELARSPRPALRQLGELEDLVVEPPPELARAFVNVNTPEDLARLED